MPSICQTLYSKYSKKQAKPFITLIGQSLTDKIDIKYEEAYKV